MIKLISILSLAFLISGTTTQAEESPSADLKCTFQKSKPGEKKSIHFTALELSNLAPGAHPLSAIRPRLNLPVPLALAYKGDAQSGELELTFNHTQISILELKKGASGSSVSAGQLPSKIHYECLFEAKN